MPDEIKLPKWFLVIKKMCQELSLGLASAYTCLNLDFFQAENTLGVFYQPIKLILLVFLLVCSVFSCQDWINKFRKNDK